MGKLTVAPYNVPRDEDTCETVKRFLAGSYEYKLEVYNKLLANFVKCSQILKESQQMLPVFSYTTQYAMQNVIDRIHEIESLIRITNGHIAQRDADRQKISALLDTFDSETKGGTEL